VPTEKAVKTYVDSGTTTITNKTISGSSNTLTNIANASLTNSAITLLDDSSSSISVPLGATLRVDSNTGITTSVSANTLTIQLDDPISSFNATTGSITNLTSTNADLKLIAGTTGNAPLEFTSGTNLTTAAAGAFEFDGRIFTSTPVASKRGLSPSTMLRYNTGTTSLTNTATTGQNWLGAVNLNVAAGTAYRFVGQFVIVRTAGATSRLLRTGFAGTATLTAIDYMVDCTNTGGTVIHTARFLRFINAATFTDVTTATTSTTENNYVMMQGVVRINGAGTFIPQIAFSAAPGSTATVSAGAYFEMTPIGVNNAVVNVGDWV